MIRFVSRFIQRSAIPHQPPAQRSRVPWPNSTARRSSQALLRHSRTHRWQNPALLLASPTPFHTRAPWPSCPPLHRRPTPTRAGKTLFMRIPGYNAWQVLLKVAVNSRNKNCYSVRFADFYKLARYLSLGKNSVPLGIRYESVRSFHPLTPILSTFLSLFTFFI